nr:hypothetical protein [Trentepohlia sp. YN1317]
MKSWNLEKPTSTLPILANTDPSSIVKPENGILFPEYFTSLLRSEIFRNKTKRSFIPSPQNNSKLVEIPFDHQIYFEYERERLERIFNLPSATELTSISDISTFYLNTSFWGSPRSKGRNDRLVL